MYNCINNQRTENSNQNEMPLYDLQIGKRKKIHILAHAGKYVIYCLWNLSWCNYFGKQLSIT